MATTKTKTKSKTTAKKTAAKKPAAAKSKKTSSKKNVYFEAVGRRKTSIARVRIFANNKGQITVNNTDYDKYFSTEELATVSNAPLRKTKMLEQFEVTVKVLGGGKRGQAEAMRHGIARSLVKYDPELRLKLKKSGYLKRDPRKKERKKYGLKKARKAPQWSKR